MERKEARRKIDEQGGLANHRALDDAADPSQLARINFLNTNQLNHKVTQRVSCNCKHDFRIDLG